MTQTNKTVPERLEGPGITLRRLQLTDRDALAAAVAESADALGAWMPWANGDYGPDEASTFLATAWLGWQARTTFEFAVVDPEHGELLGLCGLNQRSGDSMNLGYWVRSPEAGEGVASAAAKLVSDFGINQLKLSRVRIFHAVGNVGSGRVAQKAGFQREGVLRSRLILHDVAHDAVIWSRI